MDLDQKEFVDVKKLKITANKSEELSLTELFGERSLTEEDLFNQLLALSEKLLVWIEARFNRLEDEEKVKVALGVINQTAAFIRARKDKKAPMTVNFNFPGVEKKVINATAKTSDPPS